MSSQNQTNNEESKQSFDGAGLVDMETGEVNETISAPPESGVKSNGQQLPGLQKPSKSTHGAPTTSITSRESYAQFLVNDQVAKSITILRFIMIVVWLAAACVVAYSVARYTENTQYHEFEWQFANHARKLLQSFEDAIEKKMGAIATLATTLTLHARATNQTFPFVTLPDFVVAGCNARILADALAVHWLPLVTDEQREAWEQYALEHRFHIDEAFRQDEWLRAQQDIDLGYVDLEERQLLASMAAEEDNWRWLETENDDTTNSTTEIEVVDNMLQDGTRYHPQIFAFKTNRVKPKGSGPFLPSWQRSPVNAVRQFTLNIDFSASIGLLGVLPYLSQHDAPPGVLLNRATTPDPDVVPLLDRNLLSSQYRHNVEPYAGDPETKVAYPVTDAFDDTARFVGILQTTLYWRLYFTNILPPNAKGIMCVIENTFDQSLYYRIDGDRVTYLGTDPYGSHNHSHPKLFRDKMITHAENIGSRPIIETRSYNTLPLDTNFSQYSLKVYPTQHTADVYLSKKDSYVYTGMVAGVFVIAATVFLLYDFVVQKRQRSTAVHAIQQAHRAAHAERELNEYIAHEVRNPLSAAISACSFVQSALESECDTRIRQSVRDDVGIIHSSLRFMNELLRSLLDLHLASDRLVKLYCKPTDLGRDVLQPIATMLHQRDDNFEVSWECPEDLLVDTDPLRLKQVIFNLGRNSTKFVQCGYVRLRGAVVPGAHGGNSVRIYVEDSGPGIPLEKHHNLFAKYQDSLDILSQGTGIGLCLCKQLVDIMKGDIWIDRDFDSGVAGWPGTCFIVDLQKEPIDVEYWEKSSPLALLADSVAGGSSRGGDDPILEVPNSEEAPRSTVCPQNPTDSDKPKREPQNGSVDPLPEQLSVLFVDDDMILRKLFNRMIKRVLPGWSVKEAASGETAISLAETESFDLIFMDQYMASTEKQLLGTEATRELRAQGVECVICGLSANDVEQAFLGAGADAFMLKPMPCDKKELLRVLGELVRCRDN